MRSTSGVVARNVIANAVREYSGSSAMAGHYAVIGGGLSGAAAAAQLTKHGAKVTVYDLGRFQPGKLDWECTSSQFHNPWS